MDEIFTFRINEHYKGVSNLMKDEYYCIMIENFGEDVTLTIEISDEEKKENEENEENSGLEGWKIALIVIASIIAGLFVFFLVCISIKHGCSCCCC